MESGWKFFLRSMKRESRVDKHIGYIVFNNDKILVKIPQDVAARRCRSATPLASSARGQQCNGSFDSVETGPGRYVKREHIGVLSLSIFKTD